MLVNRTINTLVYMNTISKHENTLSYNTIS